MIHNFLPAHILLPKGDPTLWSVIACDQFSSERSYWDRVEETVGDAPSTLRMIVPEAYLGSISMVEAAPERNRVMEEYLKGDVFRHLENSFIYVERAVTGGKIRRGIVGKLDLDAYDYLAGENPAARASEKTVVERLPPRIQVRRGAILEMPHVLVLIDDEKRSVVEPLTEKKASLPCAYDFDLMEGGGHMAGYAICGAEADAVVAAVDALAERSVQFVIGDGNHSLAAAKDCWREIKKGLTPEEAASHPARWALVEVCNVYDEGIKFEPIHRIVFDGNAEKILERLVDRYGDENGRPLRYLTDGMEGEIRLKNESLGAFIAHVQEILDEVEKEGAAVDYIHDDESLRALAEKKGSLALFMPLMEKGDLFRTVERSGVFPKKSFSIGHARDKRYYTECRKIQKD